MFSRAVIQDGNYYFLIQKAFKWGFLSHPWEQTITIFGKGLIDSINKNKPKFFHTIIRQG